jgi:hypothetical protein
VSSNLVISLGYEGPTDSCLVLSDGKVTKQFEIESNTWVICSKAAYNKEKGCYDYPKVITAKNHYYPILLDCLYTDTTEQEFP